MYIGVLFHRHVIHCSDHITLKAMLTNTWRSANHPRASVKNFRPSYFTKQLESSCKKYSFTIDILHLSPFVGLVNWFASKKEHQKPTSYLRGQSIYFVQHNFGISHLRDHLNDKTNDDKRYLGKVQTYTIISQEQVWGQEFFKVPCMIWNLQKWVGKDAFIELCIRLKGATYQSNVEKSLYGSLLCGILPFNRSSLVMSF